MSHQIRNLKPDSPLVVALSHLPESQVNLINEDIELAVRTAKERAGTSKVTIVLVVKDRPDDSAVDIGAEVKCAIPATSSAVTRIETASDDSGRFDQTAKLVEEKPARKVTTRLASVPE